MEARQLDPEYHCLLKKDAKELSLDEASMLSEAAFNIQYYKLSATDKQLIESLYAAPQYRAAYDLPFAAFKTNQHQYGTADDTALYPLLARANHSCAPNAFILHPHGISEQYMLCVARTIAPFDAKSTDNTASEITISYLAHFLEDRDARQRRLALLGFRCVCSACSLPRQQRKVDDGHRADIKRFLASTSTVDLDKVRPCASLDRYAHEKSEDQSSARFGGSCKSAGIHPKNSCARLSQDLVHNWIVFLQSKARLGQDYGAVLRGLPSERRERTLPRRGDSLVPTAPQYVSSEVLSR